GGAAKPVSRLEPILATLAPGVAAASRTPGRTGDAVPEEIGWLHCGPSGAGHFVEMVHNGIEYGLMAAYAEGLNILEHADAGSTRRRATARAAVPAAPVRPATPAHPPRSSRPAPPVPPASLRRRDLASQTWRLHASACFRRLFVAPLHEYRGTRIIFRLPFAS